MTWRVMIGSSPAKSKPSFYRLSHVRLEPRIKTCKAKGFSFLKVYPNLGEAKSLEPETQTTSAEPGAAANEVHCHGLCSEQHTPRQRTSSLSLNVRQK